ncbi:ABC transporter substrate-binding protein [Haloimpatiens sp. FM7330]|uniref:ABC transporter substrate-binding protein n=1 Tax=Haloimpatiens sp. FM7330 TaxID=3298610 RepID=UPI00363118DB
MRKINSKVIALIIVLSVCTSLICVGCGNKATNKVSVQKTSTSKEIKLKYSKGFNIKYLEDGVKIVTDGENRKLLLVPRGKKAPKDYKLPVIYTPVKKIVPFSTIQVSILRALGELDSVVGVTTKEDKWFINDIKKGMKDGKIAFVGKSRTPDYEKIQSIKPEVVILHTGSSSQDKQMAKMDELGIPYFIDNDYMEKTPLGRLEWIKLLGAFYNKDKEAEEYFNKVEVNIKNIENKVKSNKKPKVAYAFIFKGKVYVPRGGSYYSKIIEKAGGDYILKDLEPNKPGNAKISVEEFYAKAMNADILIYDNTSDISVKSIKDIVNHGDVLSQIKPIKDGKVFGINKCYWQSSDKIDEIIQDMTSVFYPQQFKDSKHNYYYKLH